MKIAFPAIFRQEKDSDAINIVFPDILGAVSCGYGYENAMFMAREICLRPHTNVISITADPLRRHR